MNSTKNVHNRAGRSVYFAVGFRYFGVGVVGRYTAVIRTVSASGSNFKGNFQKPEFATTSMSPTRAFSLLNFSSFDLSLHASKDQQLSLKSVCTMHSCNPKESAGVELRFVAR